MAEDVKDVLITALRTAASEIGLEQRHLDAILQNLKPAIRLVPCPGDTVSLGGTFAGGCPHLPGAVRWPFTAGSADQSEPMPFMLQVNLDEVAPLDIEHRLPPTGLLSFFFYTVDEDSGEEGCVLYLPDPLSGLKERKTPAGVAQEDRYRRITLEPRAEWTLPSCDVIDMEDSEAWFALYKIAAKIQGLFAVAGDTFQLLGHPSFIQPYDPRGEGQELLLQVRPSYTSGEEAQSTGMCWGDGGEVYFLMRTVDLQARVFDRIKVYLDMC